MPFKLRKAPKRELYWVVDASGKHYSKDPLPKEKAQEQMKALYAAEGRGELKGGMPPASPLAKSLQRIPVDYMAAAEATEDAIQRPGPGKHKVAAQLRQRLQRERAKITRRFQGEPIPTAAPPKPKYPKSSKPAVPSPLGKGRKKKGGQLAQGQLAAPITFQGPEATSREEGLPKHRGGSHKGR
jgi:hypothetical protein